MYLSIPEVFYCSVKYVNKSILEIDSPLCVSERHDKSIKIGAILPSGEKFRWSKIRYAMEHEAKLKGVDISIEYSDFDINKERAIIKRMILEKIDVLVLGSVNHKGEKEILDEVNRAGIKIIAQDALINNCHVDLYLGFNILRAGQLQGGFLINKVPEGKYIILYGCPNGELLKKGAMEYITPLIDTRKVKVVADEAVKGWMSDRAYDVVKKIIVEDKNIVAVLAPTDNIAEAVIKALSEENLQGKVIVTGQDADPEAIKRILEGTQAMTLLNDSMTLGRITIESAINLIEGQSINYDYIVNNEMVDVQTILIDPILIDKSNVYSKLKETGYAKEYLM